MGSFGYINPYSFGGNIIAMTGSGISTNDGGGPPWKDQNHYDITRCYYSRGPGPLADYNSISGENGFPQFWHEEGNVMTGYLARIDGAVGPCSVRYRTLQNSFGGGTHFDEVFAMIQNDEGDPEELWCGSDLSNCPESAEAGLNYSGVTGHIHWGNGDTGIKSFTIQTHVVVDYVDADLACVVRIDKPTGCHFKVRYTDETIDIFRKGHCDYSTVFSGVPERRGSYYGISGEDGVDRLHVTGYGEGGTRYPHIDFTFIIKQTNYLDEL